MLDYEVAVIRLPFESPKSEIGDMRSPFLSSPVGFRLLVAVAALVSPAVLLAQGFGAAARIIEMTGRVSVLKDGTEWARATGDLVEPKQIIITGEDGYAKFQLADGSTFEVFQNTKTIFGGNGVELRTGDSIRVFKDQPLARTFDKGNAARLALRAAAEAVYDVLYRRTISGGGPTGGAAGGGTPAGDKGPTKGGSGGTNGPNAGGPAGGGTAAPPPAPTGP